MAETLADLLREAGIDDNPYRPTQGYTPGPYRRGYRPGAELPPQRPPPMSPAQQDARRAVERMQPAQREFTGVSPLQDAGNQVFEMTGLPAMRRAGQDAALGDWRGAAVEGGIGALTLSGLAAGRPATQAARPPRGIFGGRRAAPTSAPTQTFAPLTAPHTSLPAGGAENFRPSQMFAAPQSMPRLPGRASDGSILPMRTPQPFRRTAATSGDLREAAQRPDAGQRGVGQVGRPMSAAVRDLDTGQVYTGDNHFFAAEAAEAAGARNIDSAGGFVDRAGNYLTREEAAQRLGITHRARADAGDLERPALPDGGSRLGGQIAGTNADMRMLDEQLGPDLRRLSIPGGDLDFPTGHIEYRPAADGWHIQDVNLDQARRGQRLGVGMYEELIQRARAAGAAQVFSGARVTPEAERVWASLERRGYPVTRGATAGAPRFAVDLTGGSQQALPSVGADDLRIGRNADGPTYGFDVNGVSYEVSISRKDGDVGFGRSNVDGRRRWQNTGDTAPADALAVYRNVDRALRADAQTNALPRYRLGGTNERQRQLYQAYARTRPSPEGYVWQVADTGEVFAVRSGTQPPARGPRQ